MNNYNNTLLFYTSDGYTALCEFLEVSSCPQEDFPQLYSSKGVAITGYFVRATEMVMLIVPLIAIITQWKRLIRPLCSSKHDKSKQS